MLESGEQVEDQQVMVVRKRMVTMAMVTMAA